MAEEVLLYSELNVLSFVAMVIIAIGAIRSNESITYKIKLFAWSVFAAAAANVFDFLWNLGLDGYLDVSSEIKIAINFCYFTSLGIASFSWFMYTEAVFNDRRPKKSFWFLAGIPLFILFALLVVSAFTGCAFYFDAKGEYNRGPLFFAQHILSYGYILGATLLCFCRATVSDNFARRHELLTLASFVIPPVICALLQVFMQNLPILSVGLVISYLLIYVKTMIDMISQDDLTKIPNRRDLYRHLYAETKILKQDESLYFMFIDIDDFKQINDRYSHAEGDKALCLLASALAEIALRSDGFCARYGGDEFAFVVKFDDEAELSHIMDNIKTLALRKSRDEGLACELNVSIGCARYDESMPDVSYLVQSADKAMYEEKKRKSTC